MIGFARTNDFVGRTIRFGEFLRFRSGDKWNHVFHIDSIKDGIPYVLQADARGVTNDKPLSSVGEYVLMDIRHLCDTDKVLFFARKQIKDRYSWSTILAIAVDIILPQWAPSFRSASKRKTSWICSTLGAEALRFGGWYHDWPDIYFITPAQLSSVLVAEFSHETVESTAVEVESD